jgi:putative transposase
LKNAFPFDSAPKYLIFDRNSIFSARVKNFIKDMSIKPKVISYKCPWQNGVAERFVLSVRNDMLNQMIIFNKDQLRDFMKQYFDYYNNERCHLSVGRDSPTGREIQNKPFHFKSFQVIQHHAGSLLTFVVGQILNPYLFHYRTAFAFSSVPLPASP